MSQLVQPDASEMRARAIKRLQSKREMWSHVLAYVLVNATLVVIWSMTGAGFFWPVFPLLGWGIGLAFHVWDVLAPDPTESRIQAEIEAMRRRS